MKSFQSNIFLFNPTCEYAVANGNTSWQPNRLLQKMEYDLSALPLYLAGENDYIITEYLPSDNFLNSIKKLKPDIPGFIPKNEINKVNIPVNNLLPWGWSPAAHKLLSPLKSNCSSEFMNSPIFSWTANHKEIYSKKFACNILNGYYQRLNPII